MHKFRYKQVLCLKLFHNFYIIFSANFITAIKYLSIINVLHNTCTYICRKCRYKVGHLKCFTCYLLGILDTPEPHPFPEIGDAAKLSLGLKYVNIDMKTFPRHIPM